jgi:hypothetical protein
MYFMGIQKKSTTNYLVYTQNCSSLVSEEQLRKASKNTKRLSGGGRPIRYGGLDDQLIQCFHDRQAVGVPCHQESFKT